MVGCEGGHQIRQRERERERERERMKERGERNQ